MSSPITLSGFSGIDFNIVINALMQQASLPLVLLESQQQNDEGRLTALNTFESRVTAVDDAATDLASSEFTSALAASSSDSSAVNATAGSGAVSGHYEVVVSDLARAQVTVSASSSPDADTTTVATGGSLTIGAATVTLTGSVTLQGLAEEINSQAGEVVQASVIQSGSSAFRLVLTAVSTGSDGAFTLTNSLTGGSGVTFTDTDLDGTTGDSTEDNAIQATNASLTVNNIAVTASTNTLDSAIPGVTLQLLQEDPAATINIDVAPDGTALEAKINSFIAAYNSLVTFSSLQATAAQNGDQSSMGRDPLLRQLRTTLSSAINTKSTGGTYEYLSQIGIEFQRDGKLELNSSIFDTAIQADHSEVASILSGSATQTGVFTTIADALEVFTQAGGLIPAAQTRLEDEISRLSDRMADLEDRLALQRAAMQQEYIAAQQAMSIFQNQVGSLSSFGASSSRSSLSMST